MAGVHTVVAEAPYLRKLKEKVKGVVDAGAKDDLTGLPGLTALEQHLSRLGETEGVASLALFDIDNLGAVNEVQGKEAGDQVLKGVATLLSKNHPGAVYCIAGDEFAVVLPGVAPDHAARRMDALRAQLAVSPSLAGANATVSVGVTEAPRTTKGEPFALAAQKAVLAAKRAGKKA